VSEFEFRRLTRDALDAIPEEFDRHLAAVTVVLAEPEDTDTPHALALYTGAAHLTPGQWIGGFHPMPVVKLFPNRIEAWANAAGADITETITRVVIHEIAHHFGISHERMDALGFGMRPGAPR
jgi:predicted Zn-dependent protease with MMP-like domain